MEGSLSSNDHTPEANPATPIVLDERQTNSDVLIFDPNFSTLVATRALYRFFVTMFP